VQIDLTASAWSTRQSGCRRRTTEDLAQAAFVALDARVAVGGASARTVASYSQRWRTHLAPRIGRRKLNDITKRTVLSLRD
jgi:hypothetical protein